MCPTLRRFGIVASTSIGYRRGLGTILSNRSIHVPPAQKGRSTNKGCISCSVSMFIIAHTRRRTVRSKLGNIPNIGVLV